MATIAAIFLMGCSLCTPQIRTEYVETKAFKFVPIDVNVTEIKKVEPFDFSGKIEFKDDTNRSVCMEVDTWISILGRNRKKDTAIRRHELHENMYGRALDAVNKQIRAYLKLMEE